MFNLIVQTAQHAFLRARVVVLHKLLLQSCDLSEVASIEAFIKEAALIAKNLGLDDQYTRQLSSRHIHSLSPASLYKY